MTTTTAYSYDTYVDAIVINVWERWTKNGLGLDDSEREQTTKSVQDAVNNVWQDGMTTAEWQDAALHILTHTLKYLEAIGLYEQAGRDCANHVIYGPGVDQYRAAHDWAKLLREDPASEFSANMLISLCRAAYKAG